MREEVAGLLSHSFECQLVCLFFGALCWALALFLVTAKEPEADRLSSRLGSAYPTQSILYSKGL